MVELSYLLYQYQFCLYQYQIETRIIKNQCLVLFKNKDQNSEFEIKIE